MLISGFGKGFMPKIRPFWGLVRWASDITSQRSSIDQILHDKSLIGRRLNVQGWITSSRVLKRRIFLDLDDGVKPGQRLQVVLDKDLIELKNEELIKFHSSVGVQGVLRKSEHPAQDVELVADEDPTVFSSISSQDYPFFPKKVYMERHNRSYPTYRSKLKDFAALLRSRNALSQSIHRFFQSQDFIHIHTPILTSNDCEGGSEVFQAKPLNIDDQHRDYFHGGVNLTVSGQLHLEASGNGIAKVYNFNPAFRAERGGSWRHLCEFWMIEAEVGFVKDFSEVLNLSQKLVKAVLGDFVENHSKEIDIYSKITKQNNMKNVMKLINNEFKVMTYREALDVLERNADELDSVPKFGKSLGKSHEFFLVDYCDNIPVFIVDWPKQTKPFYCKQDCSDPDIVQAFDLLCPSVGELIGGSLRENDFDRLEARISEFDPDARESLDWYLQMRSNGSAPSGGFGLGFERLVQFILGVKNIKDTVPFPRTPHFCPL